MGIFDNTNFGDPATQAQMAFAASMMQGRQGLFPSYGAGLLAGQQAAGESQQFKARNLGIADTIRQMQVWTAKINDQRRQAGLPDLTIDDLMSGKYNLLPRAAQGNQTSNASVPQQIPNTADQQVPVQTNAGTLPGHDAGTQKQISSFFGMNPDQTVKGIEPVESGGNPNTVSPAGATGPMQVMPATAANPGFGVTPAKYASPSENIRVGTDYFNALTQKYGDQTKALIAYNMGPGATDKWLAAGGDFNKLPDETKKYLGSVAVAASVAGRASPNADIAGVIGHASPDSNNLGQHASISPNLSLYDPDLAMQIGLNLQQKQQNMLTPEETAQIGLPPGTVAQSNPITGLEIVSKPDYMSQKAFDQQLQIWGQRTGMSLLNPTASGVSGQPSKTEGNQTAIQPTMLHGEDFLKSIDPKLAGTVKLIGDGKMTLQSVASRMPGPMRLSLTDMVTQYNPSFDETTMPMRRAAAVSFASGQDSQRIQAFNASAAHIASARPMLEALKNGNYPLFNSLAQRFAQETGSAVPTNAKMIAAILGSELTKAISGYQNAEGDRREMKSPFDSAASPQQLLGALDTAEEYASGQLRAERQKYVSKTHLQDFNDMLVPEARAILASHPGEADKASSSSTAQLSAKGSPNSSPSQSDLDYTAKKYGITVDEVKKRLGIK